MFRKLRRLGGRLLDPTTFPASKAMGAGLLARSRLLRTLYYAGRQSYNEEQRVMMAGIARHHAGEAHEQSIPTYRIRRDTHRIEKGLSSSPRRASFAEKYIESLVDAVADLAKQPMLAPDLLQWSHDVLTEFFSAATGQRIDVAHRRFDRIQFPTFAGFESRSPTKLIDGPSPVTGPQLLALTERRRSVRRFLDKPVSVDDLQTALLAAREAPSACNRQSFGFLVFDEPEGAQRLVDLAPGFVLSDSALPTMIAIVGKYRAYFRERDQHVVYVDASLAAMSFILAAESLGLGTCCINWPSVQKHDDQARDLLQLADDERVIMLLAVGHPNPDALVPFSQKAPLSELVSFNPQLGPRKPT